MGRSDKNCLEKICPTTTYIYISESLTSTRKKLFGEINKERKRLKWKHIWTQNGRIFIKEADAGRSFSFNSFEDLAKFRSSLRQ